MKKKKDITPFNDKNQRHGYWERYFNDGRLMYKCYYFNGKEVGYEEYYYYKNKLQLRFHL